MQERLKPCPFCGNPKPKLHTDEIIYITCECGITTTDFGGHDDLETDIRVAIETWNTRPYQKEIDRLQIELHDMDSSAAEMRKDFNEEKARLEKETDWLAGQLSSLGNRLFVKDGEVISTCPDSVPYKAIIECISEYSGCQNCWREAARKAVEAQCSS